MITIRNITLLLSCIVALAACAARGKMGIVTLDTPALQTERIFVATTRQRSTAPYDFNGLRTTELSYARYDISIPATHEVGKIEWPKKAPDIATDFVITDAEIFETPAALRSTIKASNHKGRTVDEAVVFIHGYNNNFAESLYRFAQISNDMDMRGTPVLYAWPTTENSIEYIHDRDSVLFARDGLQVLLEQLVHAGTKHLILVGHSIGANLLMETLRQMAISGDKSISRFIDGVILISPDINQTVFLTQLNHLDPVPKPFVVFASDNDRALKVMSFLTGKAPRLGQITNSEALDKHGIQVINLSEFDDGDGFLNHTVALTSPRVIAIVNKIPTTHELIKQNNGNPESILQRLFKPTQ
ncbi:MAG: alpha/beta hydrolase [Proteobacteria bacterium]|nr:alpha/beta hydrolase [Pseudomonadota bacterium]